MAAQTQLGPSNGENWDRYIDNENLTINMIIIYIYQYCKKVSWIEAGQQDDLGNSRRALKLLK